MFPPYFLAFKRKLAYNSLYKPSCKEPFRLISYARKNSKQLFCGFFYGGTRAGMEVKMAYESTEKDDVKIIELEGKRDKGKDVFVRHGIVPPKWKKWNDDDFSREWNKKYSV